MTAFTPSQVLRAQNKYVGDLCKLRIMLAESHPDWLVKISELGTLKTRKVRIDHVTYAKAIDAVHIDDSHHYDWLGSDWSIFIPAGGGLYEQVVRSDSEEWDEVHTMWLGLDDLNRIMPLASGDAGHLSRAVNEADKRI